MKAQAGVPQCMSSWMALVRLCLCAPYKPPLCMATTRSCCNWWIL